MMEEGQMKSMGSKIMNECVDNERDKKDEMERRGKEGIKTRG